MITISLRFDDPSPTSDHALEREIFGILGELGITATVAVVPFGVDSSGYVPLTRDNVPHLIEAHTNGTIEVAQHGWAHEHIADSPQGSPSEFCGVPAEEQYRRIEEGYVQLEKAFGQPIRGFIPPWNTYDDVTARRLVAQGYGYLSGTLVTPPAPGIPLCVIPRTCDVHQLREAYSEASRHRAQPTTIVVIMHHYDFIEYGPKPGKLSLQEFRAALIWLKQQPEVQFICLQQLATDLGVAGSQAALRRHLKKDHLHWRVQRWLPKTMLMTRYLWIYLLPWAKTRS